MEIKLLFLLLHHQLRFCFCRYCLFNIPVATGMQVISNRREKASTVNPGFNSTSYKLTSESEWDCAAFFKLAQRVCGFSFHSHLWLLAAYPSFQLHCIIAPSHCPKLLPLCQHKSLSGSFVSKVSLLKCMKMTPFCWLLFLSL